MFSRMARWRAEAKESARSLEGTAPSENNPSMNPIRLLRPLPDFASVVEVDGKGCARSRRRVQLQGKGGPRPRERVTGRRKTKQRSSEAEAKFAPRCLNLPQ